MTGDWWSEFSNNLATDLAPLISLFGEAPTKQYLSECLNTTDIVIFSMAPLGIITIVVSAIRVCGTPSLRAFIGRAQEGAGNAEAELCSSTSREVCELYNNGGIARVFGRPKLLEIVHDLKATNDDFYQKDPGAQATAGIYLFKDYLKKDKQEWEEVDKRSGDEEKELTQDGADKERDFAINPNLSLNVGIKQSTKHWFTAAAILGVLLQSSVLAWAAVARYKMTNVKKDLQDTYAVPMTVIGTFLLCAGTALCASLIENSTKERVFERKNKRNESTESASQVYWVQPGTQFVGDQAFDSFAYTHPKGEFTRYITSWKTGKNGRNGIWVWSAIICTSLGFLLQFLGLRACHSSVAVAQLGVTIVMSVVRSMLRANRLSEEEVSLAHKPDLYKGHELDWLALNLGTEPKPSHTEHESRLRWIVSSASYHTADISEIGWKILGQPSSTQSQSFPNKHTEFRKMSVAHGGSCILSGFQLDSDEPIGSQDKQSQCQNPEDWWDSNFAIGKPWPFDVKVAPERWRTAAQSGSSRNKLIAVQSEFAKPFMYRARLARLTDSWDEKLVSVRGTARILVKAIESTMRAFITTDIRLEKGWDSSFALCWAIPCELKGKDDTNGNVYLSLRREIDKNGRSGGIWHADESELEAVLGLWLWSIRSIGIKQAPLKRILSVKPDSVAEKNYTADFNLWREGGGSSIEETEIELNRQTCPLFGRHNIPSKYHATCTVLEIAADTRSLPIMCAQEIYSLFFSSIVHAIKDIGGKTEVQRSGFSLANTNISKIQSSFTESGLGSVGDAFTCIFPALIIQEKLPHVLEALSNIKEAADIHINEEKWEEAEQLLLWALPHSQEQKMTSIPGEDQIGEAELINHQRLLTLSLCECYRKALLSGKVEFCLNGITKMLNKSAIGGQNDIPLVATDNLKGRGDKKEGTEKRPLYTLADAVNSYGIAAIRIAQVKFKEKAGVFEGQIAKLRSTLNSEGKLHQDHSSENLNQRPTAKEQRGTLLLQAIRDGRLDSALFLLDEESAVNDGEKGGESLSLATQQGWNPVVKALVDHGAALEWKDKEGRSAISYAAERGDINSYNYLLAKGAFPIVDNVYRTPLFYAARYGHVDIMKSLLTDGRIEPNAKDKSDGTPLSTAAENGHKKAVELLLSTKRVEVECLDKYLRTPLSLAAANGHSDVVSLLLAEEGVTVDSADGYGRTPLSYAAENDHDKVMRLLLAREEITPGLLDEEGKSALRWAASNYSLQAVNLLLAYRGLALDNRALNSLSPTSLKVVELLETKKAVDANSRDNLGNIPPFSPVQNGSTNTAKTIGKTRTLDMNSRRDRRQNSLLSAVKWETEETVKTLMGQEGVDLEIMDYDKKSALTWAAQRGQVSIVKLLADTKRVDLNWKDFQGDTPLCWAVLAKKTEVAELLIKEYGVDINAGGYCGSPLIQAAEHCNLDILRLLLSRGEVEIEARDSEGTTALLAAVARVGVSPHAIEATKLLLDNGANINATMNAGWSSLHVVALKNHKPLLHMFLGVEGLKLNPETIEGETPLDFALKRDNFDLADVLKGVGCRRGHGKESVVAKNE